MKLLKEGLKDDFTYCQVQLEFNHDRIETGEIIIPNPNYKFRSKQDIFISIKTIIIYMKDLKIKSTTNATAKITSLAIDALGNYIK